MTAVIAVAIAVALIVGVVLVLSLRRGPGRHKADLFAGAVEAAEKAGTDWWRDGQDEAPVALPAAMQSVGVSQRAFKNWHTGQFAAADAALVRDAMKQEGGVA